jgi:YVTN family beta-propeller protein
VSLDGATLYVTNSADSTVSVIDTATGTVVATVDGGGNPSAVTVSPDGGTAYYTNLGGVSVLDTATNTIARNIDLRHVDWSGSPQSSFPSGVAISPDGSVLYAVLNGLNQVAVINTADYNVSKIALTGYPSPQGVAISPNGARLYVANQNGTVSVINTADNTVAATITGLYYASAVAVSPDGKTVYVTNRAQMSFDDMCGSDPFCGGPPPGGTISVIDTITNTITHTITVGYEPSGVTVSPDGSSVYVTNLYDGTVSVINAATNTVTNTITVGNQVRGVTVSPDGTRAYVARAARGLAVLGNGVAL